VFTVRELWAAVRLDRGGRVAIGVAVALVGIQVTVMAVGGAAAARDAHASTRDMFTFAASVSVNRATAIALSTQGLTREVAEIVGSGPTPEHVRVVLARELEANPSVRTISVTFPDGTYYDVRAKAEGRGFLTRTRTVDAGGIPTWESTSYGITLVPTSTAGLSETLDPFAQPAYGIGASATGPTWTYPSVDPATQGTDVWLARPVRDAQGKLVAVVAASPRLDVLSSNLNDLSGRAVEAYVLAPDRTIVAAPESAASVIAAVQTKTHEVATAATVGLYPSKLANSGSTTSVLGNDGNLVTIEVPLPSDAAPWVVHVQASLASLSPAAAHLRNTLLWMAALLGIALIAGLAIVLRTARPLSRLRANAEVDTLTGLNNRHHFERRAKQVVAHALSDGKVIAVAMVDLDNFKGLNDLRGHEQGDAALAMVGQVLLGEVRDTDMAIRWGGDEFVLVFALAQGIDPTTVVERVRAHVSVALDIKFGSAVRLGATAGFAVLSDPRESLLSTVSRADAALVAGKRLRKGRTYDVAISAAQTEPPARPASMVRGRR
jgi:diguanylate cyclase (GGDEF)-like protein